MASSNQKPFNRRRHVIQSIEAQEAGKRTTWDRVADAMTSALGSMGFLAGNAVFFAVWMAVNSGMFPIVPVFDPFPFGLLTMLVSLEAIGLSIIVLISQNRAAKIGVLREEVDLQINTIAEEEITKTMKLIVKLLEKHGIDTKQDAELRRMLRPADTEKIEESIDKQINGSDRKNT